MENTEITPVKKRSSFKRGLMYLLVLSVLGGAGYVAYEQGAIDPYLPNVLKAVEPVPPAPIVTPPAVVADAPVANAGDVQAVLNQMQGTQAGTPSANATIANNAPAAAPSVSTAPIVLSINGAPANALLSAYDAQWQWQMIEQSFKAQGDAANTLQQVQTLKTQLQSTNSAAFAPSVTALTQVEAQLQAWLPLQTAAYSSALSQTLADVDAMQMKTADASDITQAVGEQTWWQRILASLKNVIEIKRVDEQKNAAALEVSTAALVKQSIIARLNSAQFAAQNGQWAQAKSHAAAATAIAQQWADEGALAKLKPLLDVASFPTMPDFATVNSALMQARTQLVNDAHAAQAVPAPAPVVPADAAKGGA